MKQQGFSRLSSDTISTLRFPLMVGIVFIHIGMKHVLATKGIVYATDMPQWYIYMVSFFSNVLPRIGVPLFFLMSGYLFFRSGELSAETYKAKLKKRATTLLVPYIIWNAIAIFRAAMVQLPVFSSSVTTAKTVEWSFLNVIGCFYNTGYGVFRVIDETADDGMVMPQDFPLWYVRDLMIVILLSPLFYQLIKKLGWYLVLALGVAWFFTWGSEDVGYLRQLVCATFFFSWGACYAIKGIDFVASMSRFKIAPYIYAVVAIVDMLTKGGDYSAYIHHCGIILGIFTAVLLTARLLESGKMRPNKFLTDSTFFIYALHGMITTALGKMIVKIWFVDNPIFLTVLYFAIPVISISVCLALYWLLRRYAPKLCAVLTGGR